jgi:hypothetical protein
MSRKEKRIAKFWKKRAAEKNKMQQEQRDKKLQEGDRQENTKHESDHEGKVRVSCTRNWRDYVLITTP